MDDVPAAFDWVKARAECSVEQLFLMLAEVVDADVKAIHSQPKQEYRFRMLRPADSKIIVVKSAGFSDSVDLENVVFTRTKSRIEVVKRRHDGRADNLFMATPGLNEAGVCRLDVDGQPLELWQVSRKALEALFFVHED